VTAAAEAEASALLAEAEADAAAASASSAASSAATATAAVLTVGVPSLGVFTGTGVQTAFTLPATPPSTNAIMVFVGGVHQERTKFSYSGTTLTFVTAPPNGAPIQVVIGASLNSTSFTNTVGLSELAAIPTQRALGRNGAGLGAAEHVSLTQILDWIGSAAQGDILYRGASNWERLAAGTSGRFLQTQGAGANPQWVAASSGLVFLSAQTASASATVDFTTGISATYDEYEIRFDAVVPASANANLLARVTTNAGSTWESTNYRGTELGWAGATTALAAAPTDAIYVTPRHAALWGIDTTAANGGASGIMRFRPNNAGGKKNSEIIASFCGISPIMVQSFCSGQWNGANTVLNGIRFLMNTGNIASGTFRLYGVQRV